MKIRTNLYSFALAVSGVLLLSCGRHTTSSEKTSFTHVDSLTDTYLALQDTLLHSWNVVVKDEQEKLEVMSHVIRQFHQLPLTDFSQVAALQSRLEQFKQLQLTPKTLSNQHVIAEHDVAAHSLVSDILSISKSYDTMIKSQELQNWLQHLKNAHESTLQYRSGYDSIASAFNQFLEKNKHLLQDIDKSGSLEKRPTFTEAAGK